MNKKEMTSRCKKDVRVRVRRGAPPCFPGIVNAAPFFGANPCLFPVPANIYPMPWSEIAAVGCGIGFNNCGFNGFGPGFNCGAGFGPGFNCGSGFNC